MERKYLVTGGAGFIGSHLTERLLDQGGRVTVIDNLSTGKMENLVAVQDNEKLNIIIDSIMNEELMEKLIQEVDEVYHLASSVGVELIMREPIHTIENIFQGRNISASIRSADCFGIQDVNIIENDNIFNDDSEVSMGAEKWITTKKFQKQ